MSVTKNKNGINEYNFMVDGIRYHRSFKGLSYEEVKAKEAEARTQLKIYGHKPLKNKKYHICEIIEDYKQYKVINHTRPHEMNYVLDNFYKIVKNVDIQAITSSDINRYIASRKGKVKDSSINRELDVIKRVFSLAVEYGKLDKNPCSSIKKLRIKNPPKRFLKKDEEEKLLAVSNEIMQSMIIVAVYTGLRTNELLNLKWEDVFIRDNMPYIYVRETKNNEPRSVPMIKKVKNTLIKIPNESEYVFTSPVTKTKYTDIKTSFARSVKRSGIPHITFHELRHTTSSRLNELGVDPVVIMEILGHKDIKITLRYLHTTEQYKFDAMNKLDNY